MSKSDVENKLARVLAVPPYLRAYGATAHGVSTFKDAPQSEDSGESERYSVSRALGSRLKLRKVGLVLAVLILVALVVASSVGYKAWAERDEGSGASGMYAMERPEEEVPVSLLLGASNEYGKFDQHALALYNLDIVVEPFRETKLTIVQSATPSSTFHPATTFRWHLILADENGTPLEGVVDPIVNSKGGNIATVTLTEPGKNYALLVEELRGNKVVVGMGRATIACKYVRRELRDLTAGDRRQFFAALKEFYSVEEQQGKEKYGEGFLNYATVAALHNSKTFCYHNGLQFLTGHAAFDMVVERSLQMINPRVSLAFWDFMVDADVYGTDWPSSKIFGSDMFGSAFGKEENGYQISDGWFAGISGVYDPTGDRFPSWIDANHNPYGFMTAGYNFQRSPGVTRTHSYCGMKGEAAFTKCDTFIRVFDECDTVSEWATDMENKVHASLHGMIGGGFRCNTNMETFMQEHPEYGRPLLTFALEYLLANKWPGNSLMHDFNSCDESCEVGMSCGCTCNVDPFEMDDDEVYEFMGGVMVKLHHRANGEAFVYQDDDDKYPLGFMQDGERLSNEQTLLLLRVMMVIACEPGEVGAMSGGASPSDPIFWVLHPIFEKAFHILLLSPEYGPKYDLSWVDGTCYGSRLDDEMPFSEKSLGFGERDTNLTNSEIIFYMNPANGKLNYLYDSFRQWGTCTDWDPCPTCQGRVQGEGITLEGPGVGESGMPQMARSNVDSLEGHDRR